MVAGKKYEVKVNGIGSLNTRQIPSLVRDNQLTASENMNHNLGGVEIRLGSEEFKDNSQWEDVAIIDGVGYKLDDEDAEIAFLLEDGRIAYQKVNTISDSPTEIFNPTQTYDFLAPVLGSSTPLTITDKDEVFIQVLNNKVFLIDGGTQIKYYGANHELLVVPDPTGYEIRLNVDSGVIADIDDTYTDLDDPTRVFNVELDKVAGDGTVLLLRQIEGKTRPDSNGVLSMVVGGSGDSSISWTAIEYSDRYVSMGTQAGRLTVLSAEGYEFIGEPNDGTNMSGSQSEVLAYGKEEGLRVTNVTPFKRGQILSLTEPVLQKSAMATLGGYRKYDTNTPERTDGLFKIERESNMMSIYGRSGREIGNGFIGLTKKGFVTFSAFGANAEFGITDASFISEEIRNVVNRTLWQYSNKIRSCIDENNQRYWCAVPASGTDGNTLVFVYDFGISTFADRSAQGDYRWSLYTFAIGERTITSLFTIFGHPFLGLSDGTVAIAEVQGVYTDLGTIYSSSFTSKHFDFGNRIKVKNFRRGIIDLLLAEKQNLNIFAVTDGEARTKDWDKRNKALRKIVPIDLVYPERWSNDPADVWTNNPFDIWGYGVVQRYPVVITGINAFRELAITVENKTGGKWWGCYGYEFDASDVGDWADTRPIKALNKAASSPATLALLSFLPELSMLVSAACYNSI